MQGNEAPLVNCGEITQNKKLFEVETIEFDAYDWPENDIAYQMITERSLMYLPDTEQWYRVLNRSTSSLGDVMVNHVTAFHVLHDLNDHYVKAPVSEDTSTDDDKVVSMSIDQFMRYILANTKFSYSLADNFGSATFSDYPEGRALDLFLNDGREAFGYEFTVNNYHIELCKRVGQDNSFVFVDNGNVTNINSVYDDSTITTHIKGESTIHVKDTSDTDDSNQGSNNQPATPTYAIGTISTMEAGGAPVYSSPVGGHATGRRLANGTSWKIDKQISVDDKKWYRVSGTEWVSEDYMSFDKSGDVKPESHDTVRAPGQGTIKAADNSNSDDENHKAPTAANVYNSPWTPQHVVLTLPNGSRWKIDKKVDDGAGGKTWYRVAPDQWVASDDFDFSGSEDVTPTEPSSAADTDDGTSSEVDEEDKTIYAEYTSDNASVYGIVDADYYQSDKATNADELINELKKQIQDYPLMELTLEYHEFQDGLVEKSNDVQLGNSGFIKDRHGIDISSRIVEMTNYLQSPTNHEPELVFGNIIGDLTTTLRNLNSNNNSTSNMSSTVSDLNSSAIIDFFAGSKWTEEDVKQYGRS